MVEIINLRKVIMDQEEVVEDMEAVVIIIIIITASRGQLILVLVASQPHLWMKALKSLELEDFKGLVKVCTEQNSLIHLIHLTLIITTTRDTQEVVVLITDSKGRRPQ